MAVKKTTAQQTNTTHKTAVKKSTVKKPAAAKTAAKKSTAKKSVKTVTKDKPADYRIGELDQYLFGQGTHYEIYKKMGAHFVKDGKKSGVYFAVWAPHARSVSVIGEFNGWSEDANVMKRQEPLGIYTAFVPEAQLGQLYKYCIETQTGDKLYKADPFANSAELRPGTASRIADISHLKWSDSVWMKHRAEWDFHSSPISIYEAHIGSWMRHPGREDEGFYSYREFAHAATDYIKKMGYTHIELMGISEYPFDGSWGYQVTGYYAPTSRYGTPEDFAYMINYFHKNKIGVILDWVPAHFPRDAHGLADFDGTATFEYADPKKGEHPDWGTKIFDYGKAEVKNFLIANALFWIEHYHIDGLRVDAVASMLYLDFGREYGQWKPNIYGTNENLEAVEFLKHLNSILDKKLPGTLTIAQEDGLWSELTGSVEDDNIGFDYKWNNNWAGDFLAYLSKDPIERKYVHDQLTLSMIYAYCEHYVLPLGNREAGNLAEFMEKLPGDEAQKLSQVRAAYAYMMMHPGCTMMAPGKELPEEMEKFIHDLNELYRTHPALIQKDDEYDGFEWIQLMKYEENVLTFMRKTDTPEETLLVVCNFAAVPYTDYKVGVPFFGKYKEIFNTDAKEYGGQGTVNPRGKTCKQDECDEREYSIKLKVPALGVTVFSCTPTKKREAVSAPVKKTEKKPVAKKPRVSRKSSRAAVKEPAATVKEEKKVLVKEAVTAPKKTRKTVAKETA